MVCTYNRSAAADHIGGGGSRTIYGRPDTCVLWICTVQIPQYLETNIYRVKLVPSRAIILNTPPPPPSSIPPPTPLPIPPTPGTRHQAPSARAEEHTTAMNTHLSQVVILVIDRVQLPDEGDHRPTVFNEHLGNGQHRVNHVRLRSITGFDVRAVDALPFCRRFDLADNVILCCPSNKQTERRYYGGGRGGVMIYK